jgi:queuine tRNA-ribosyltransferase
MATKKAAKPILVPPSLFSEAGRFSYSGFSFDVTHRDPANKARIGQLKTPHGTIETPNYIFCGTKGAIKNLHPSQMREAGADIILSNTYHMMIQPGADIVGEQGGLQKWTAWNGPMMTDSGGFQIFSMGHGSVADEIKGRNRDKTREKSLLKITEEGAIFRSYKDGSAMNLTPELSMDIQRKLGADLIFQLDECTAFHVDKDYTERSMHMSHRWGDRCLAAFSRHDNGMQALYGITQGGVYEDLRKLSCEYTRSRPYFGTAIGGSLGGSKAQFYDVVALNMANVHPDRPVHLLGIGAIEDIFSCVRMGIDTFDCVSPTRIARHGWALAKGVPGNRLNLRNTCYRNDPTPLDENAALAASNSYSKSYLHHLLKAGEMLVTQIIAQHNVAVITQLMREVRAAIKNGTLDQLESEWIVY